MADFDAQRLNSGAGGFSPVHWNELFGTGLNKGNDMGNLWLTVEVRPGGDLSSTCAEAVVLAGKTDLTIWFDFNGVKCLARAGDDPRRIEDDWNRVMDSKGQGGQIASDNGEVPNVIYKTPPVV